MRVKTIAELKTAKGIIPAGQIIEIQPSLMAKLAGKVKALPFDAEYWQTEIIKLAEEISAKDPGGDCWQWMKDNRPELWKDHLAADMAVDVAYQGQDAGKIREAITKTRTTFSAMTESWKNRHQFKQPSLDVHRGAVRNDIHKS